jgi:multidrug efflux pump subunit AcrB
VSLSIPLVLAVTFVVMNLMGITLQRISLGALIISLGLLVDDAMITIEMMVSRLEAGDRIEDAATFAYTSTAFPMLTGTLVTVASFIPIGFNGSSAGEYTYSLFVVLATSLLISWLVAVAFAPLIGIKLLPKAMKRHDDQPGLVAGLFRRMLLFVMRWRWVTLGGSIALFALAVFGLSFVQQQFFPASDRPAFLVDLTLPQSSSIAATQAQVDRMERAIKDDRDVVRTTSYVGEGAVRFYLSLDPQPSDPFYAQIVVDTTDLHARDRLMAKLRAVARKSFVGTDVFVHTLELGPPVGRPIQYRLSGPNMQGVRERAIALAAVVGTNPHLGVPTFDWNEPGMVLRIEVVQDKARQLGITSQDLAGVFNSITGGGSITQVIDSIYLVPIVARAQADERTALDTFARLQVPVSSGTVVPLRAFATLRYDVEQPIVWRRDRLPTITVRAVMRDDTQAPTVVQELGPAIAKFQSGLPVGYKVEVGGTVEESGKGQGPIIAVVPIMLLAMAFVLMVQLQSVQRLFIVASVAPLGLIGVVAALLFSGRPLGFVSILGVLALIGIIIRNSVILVVQIDEHRRDGHAPWDAVVEATCHRMRPILLTAAAASLAMIPIAFEVFWGPMAFAMIRGILVATVLTLLFLPTLYVTWFRILESSPKSNISVKSEEAPAFWDGDSLNLKS